MSATIFDILEVEKGQLSLALKQCTAPAAKADSFAIPAIIPKRVRRGPLAVTTPTRAGCWILGALSVIAWVMERREIVLAKGIGEVLRNIENLAPPSKMTPDQLVLLRWCAGVYAQGMAEKLAPQRLDVLGGRNPWFEMEVRAKLYRRLELERRGRLVLEKEAITPGPVQSLWERDSARQSLFYVLCASCSMSTRPRFLREVEELRLEPQIPAEIVDREGYRQAWLEAIMEVKQEVLGMTADIKPLAKQQSATASAHRPRSQEKSGLSQSDTGPINPAASNGAGANPPMSPTIAPASAPSSPGQPESVELNFDEDRDWIEDAAVLKDAKEQNCLQRMKRIYEDFWRAAACVEEVDPASARAPLKSVFSILEDMIAVWDSLETYRSRLCTKSKARAGLVQSKEIVAGQLRLCLDRLEELARFFRDVACAGNVAKVEHAQSFEFVAMIERQVAHFQDVLDDCLSRQPSSTSSKSAGPKK